MPYNEINTNKTKATFSRLLRHPGVETEWTILVEWEGMKSTKTDESRIRKEKNEKILKDREEGGEVTG